MKTYQRIPLLGWLFCLPFVLWGCAQPQEIGPEDIDPRDFIQEKIAVATQSMTGACNVTASFNPASPSTVGTNVTLTANATCSGGSPEYKFYYRRPAGSWTVLQDWAIGNTYNWDTSNSSNGVHDFQVWVRTQGSTATFEGVSILTYTLTGGAEVCSGAATTTDVPSPQSSGTNVVLTTTASCTGGASPEFKVYRRTPAGAWSLAQDWNANPSWTWSTSGIANGSYLFQVWVRAQGSSSNFDSVALLPFTIDGAGCTTVSASTSPASPQTQGTNVSINMSANCQGGANPEFRIYHLPPGGSWRILQDWNTNASFAWNTSSEPIGNHTLQVWMREAGTSVNFTDVTAPLTYTLTTAARTAWARQSIGGGIERAWDTYVDASKNTYLVGSYGGSITLGSTTLPTRSAAPVENSYIAKLGPTGNWLWAKEIKINGQGQALSVVGDSQGNVYVAGFYSLGISIGSTCTIPNSALPTGRSYLAKINSAGTCLWIRYLREGFPFRAAVDRNDNVYVSNYNVNFGVDKYDSNGNKVWERYFPADQDPVGDSFPTPIYGLDVTPSGEVFLAGSFGVQQTFGSTVLTTSIRDGYVAKLNANGTLAWAVKTDSTRPTDFVYRIAVDSSGDAYAAGTFGLGKISGSGTWLWRKTSTSFSCSAGCALGVDAAKNIYVAGQNVHKHDNNGNVTQSWSGNVNSLGIHVEPSGAWTAVGQFTGSVSLGGQNLTANGTDLFVWFNP